MTVPPELISPVNQHLSDFPPAKLGSLCSVASPPDPMVTSTYARRLTVSGLNLPLLEGLEACLRGLLLLAHHVYSRPYVSGQPVTSSWTGAILLTSQSVN